MAFKSLITLGMLATAFAAPSGYGHSGSIRPTGSVRSHHHPSGTKVSSSVRSHSAATSLAAQASSVPIQYNQVSAVGSDDCLTVTTRIQVTVTVTGDSPSSEATTFEVSTAEVTTAIPPRSSADVSSAVVNVQILSSAVEKAESHLHYHQRSSAWKETSVAIVETSSNSPVAVVTPSTALVPTTSALPTTTSHTTSTAAAIVPVISIPAVSWPSINVLPTTTSTTAAVTTSASSSASPGISYAKRGLAYNDASLVKSLATGDKIGWAYNWGSGTSALPSNIKYIPTLWNSSDTFTKSWLANAQSAINSGSDHLFTFNEPDLAAQANMSPELAATAYKSWVTDHFGGNKDVKICAPAVTNGSPAEGYGLGWLSSFMSACTNCQIDCINIHWYGTDVSDLQTHVTQAIALAKTKNIGEVWLTEFGLNGHPSADTISTFLDTAIPYLEGQTDLTAYAYFMLSQGILVNNNALNDAGLTYMNSA